jgi:hypothetical protein
MVVNIFAVSSNPYACSIVLDDKRLNKMILETAQILCVAYNHLGLNVPYKLTHIHHPVVKWSYEDPNNTCWLSDYFLHLTNEWVYRGNNDHKCSQVMAPIFANYNIQEYATPETFVNACHDKARGIDFRHLPVHTAYQKYLCAKWDSDNFTVKWTKRGWPNWYKSKELV